MKLPYSWLKELSGVDWAPAELAKRLTASGTAGEASVPDPDHFRNVIIGHVQKVENHPNADNLKVVEVNTGKTVSQIICGAPNCVAETKVVVALPGARLQGQYEIKPVTMRGLESCGMICAEDELGLSDDHSGIIVLNNDAPIGEPVYEYLGLGDPVIDFEVTPNRPDCLSAIGVAREICVLADRDFEYIWPELRESKEKASDYIKVRIDDPDACPRFTARVIKNIKIGPSPLWIQKRLRDCGVRPINNIVDITNYVMLETNQPMHAFDYERLGSKEIVVRRAKKGEKFTTLDGVIHTLDDAVLLITNGKEGIGAGGVMGGLQSEVDENTTTVLLEAAYFNPSVIRRSARQLEISTEASYRFERGIDPNNVHRASARAVALMAEYAGGEILTGCVDEYVKKVKRPEVTLRPQQARRLIGADIADSFMVKTLRRLGLEVIEGDFLKTVVPTFRPDLEREVDLIEEVARIYGLDNIPVARDNSGPLFAPTHRRDIIKKQIREIMTGLGLDETLSSGFAHPSGMRLIDAQAEPVKITNPLSEDFSYLRTRILYSLLVSAGHNIRHRNMDLKFFEVGRVYLRNNEIPKEPLQLGIFLTGQSDNTYWKAKSAEVDLYELKGIVAALTDALNISSPIFTPESRAGYDTSQSFALFVDDVQFGYCGLVSQKIRREFDIKQDCYAAEIDISTLTELQKGVVSFKSLPRYPSSSRDIALIVEDTVLAEEIRAEIIGRGGELIESVAIFDLFTGTPVPEGKKSLAFSVDFRSPDKTLEDEEVDRIHGDIIKHLEKKFNARLRE